MKIETKFDIGDEVIRIDRSPEEKWVECETCNGTSRLDLVNGGTVRCTNNCHMGQVKQHLKPIWSVVDMILTVGQVRYKHTDSRGLIEESAFDNYSPQHNTEEEYMCVETGIGCGSAWKVDMLFKTEQEAQFECDRRNNG